MSRHGRAAPLTVGPRWTVPAAGRPVTDRPVAEVPYGRSPKTVRCQSFLATAVLSYMTCLIWVYSSKE